MNRIRDHRRQFADQPAAILQLGRRLFDESIDHLPARGASDQGKSGLVFANTAIERIKLGVRNVGWVAQNHIEALVLDGFEQISLQQADSITDPVEVDVATCEFQCLGG